MRKYFYRTESADIRSSISGPSKERSGNSFSFLSLSISIGYSTATVLTTPWSGREREGASLSVKSRLKLLHSVDMLLSQYEFTSVTQPALPMLSAVSCDVENWEPSG